MTPQSKHLGVALAVVLLLSLPVVAVAGIPADLTVIYVSAGN